MVERERKKTLLNKKLPKKTLRECGIYIGEFVRNKQKGSILHLNPLFVTCIEKHGSSLIDIHDCIDSVTVLYNSVISRSGNSIYRKNKLTEEKKEEGIPSPN